MSVLVSTATFMSRSWKYTTAGVPWGQLLGIPTSDAAGHDARSPDVAGMEAVAMRYVERREAHRAVEAAPALVDMVIRAFA